MNEVYQRSYCEEALTAADGEEFKQSDEGLANLAKLSELEYQRKRKGEAKALGVTVDALDRLVKAARAQAQEDETALPHWAVEPWDSEVDGGALLNDIEQTFRRYIVLPKGAAEALVLWTLHAWTMDTGDISPFMVLVSPTKRCGQNECADPAALPDAPLGAGEQHFCERTVPLHRACAPYPSHRRGR